RRAPCPSSRARPTRPARRARRGWWRVVGSSLPHVLVHEKGTPSSCRVTNRPVRSLKYGWLLLPVKLMSHTLSPPKWSPAFIVITGPIPASQLCRPASVLRNELLDRL